MKVLSTKLRNNLKKEAIDADHLVIELSNIRINGDSRGCSGFVGNLHTGKVVYINTEQPTFGGVKYLYRKADNFKDFGGSGGNRYAYSFGELVTNVLEMCDAV